MSITMKNYGLTWTSADGRNRASVCSYDTGSAQNRKARLEADGCTKVQIHETKPGQPVEPRP
ncbi:hypothetical protein [Streptomyces sp. NPDC046925]|uniref:hypothetical protein n=1 Tax=Streptomyces sp. NPDC046925 TaxID=3155375 RepID=UPI0033D4474E